MAGASQQPPGGGANRVPVEAGGRPAPTAPPIGRLALATQILTQAGDRPATGAPAPQPMGTAPPGQGAQPVAQAAAPRTTAMPGAGAPFAQATDAPIRGAGVTPDRPLRKGRTTGRGAGARP